MRHVEACDPIPEDAPRPYVFLGGGISGCPDWQSQILQMLEDVPHGTLINPRRAEFPMDDQDAGLRQIVWEYNRLWLNTDIFTMWFCKETLCPICLFETGAHISRHKVLTEYGISRGLYAIIVGGDPEYERRFDVETQAALALGEEASFHTTLEEHAAYIREAVNRWVESGETGSDRPVETDYDGGDDYESDLQPEEDY